MQSFKNHARWLPLYHYAASPIAALYLGYTFIHVWQQPTNGNAITAFAALALGCGIWASRVMALTVQNRVIRLEMRLKLKELLPAPLVTRIGELTVRQLVALRFASDAELPQLVERVLAKEFPKSRDIKRAIRDWQGDYLRV